MFHDYQKNREAEHGGEIGLKLKECYQELQLVDQMEEYLQHLDLLPHQQLTDPGLLQLESQFLDLCSSYNVVESAIYIVPVYHNGKLFVRYMEHEVYKGFTSKFISALSDINKIPTQNIFPWMVYTDKDFLEASIRMKYSAKTQTTRGFLQLMYKNKTSLGDLVTLLKPKLDNLHAVVDVQKKHHQPTEKVER